MNIDKRSIHQSLSLYDFSNIQYYCPILSLFRKKIEDDDSFIYKNSMLEIIQKETTLLKPVINNIYTIRTQEKVCKSFFKICPIIDPVYYLSGKYGKHEDDFLLPSPNKTVKKWNKKYRYKINNIHNNAYIDFFFNYLVSVHLPKFVHGVEIYDSFICNKQNTYCSIVEDFYSLRSMTYYKQLYKSSFTIYSEYDNVLQYTANTNKRELKIKDTIDDDIMEIEDLESNMKSLQIKDIHMDENVIHDVIKDISIDISDTYIDNNEGDEMNIIHSDEEMIEYCDEGDEGDEGDEEDIFAIFKSFPVQITCLEYMDITLDKYMDKNKSISDFQWKSILFQVIMILITYQKAFDFTHNDLHTENVMLKKTDKKMLCYKYNNSYYHVPTFGYICKIIDFGRSIFKYKDNQFCSDSYTQDGDATGQYNFGPCYNKKQDIIYPNKSFDLARLSCSLLDYFLHKNTDIIDNDLYLEICSWSKDANGKSLLYKTGFRERFPGFKLYIMIAKLAIHGIPTNVIEHDVFNCFKLVQESIELHAHDNDIMNIDEIQSFFNTNLE